MLQAINLTKIYKPKKGAPVKALDNINLVLPDKGMVFILGKSGSGKSTLLNVLGGLDRYDGGEIIIKGKSSKNFKQSDFDSYRNTYLGFIFQEYNILEEFTVGANIALAIELQGRKATDEELNRILRQVDMVGFGNRKPNELSGGQKQRVAIARALIKNPEIIMADEPTGALDSATGKQVFDALKKLSKEKLVLIVSHDRDFSEKYADRIIELADGRIISDTELNFNEKPKEETKSGLSYNGETINISNGYTLTEEDRIAINVYLKNLKSQGSVKLNVSAPKSVGGSFKNTDQSKIISANTGFSLIKSRLPLKNAFKIGGSGLKVKPVKLVFTIILSVVAFTLFGLSDTLAAYNEVKTAVNSLLDSEAKTITLQKNKKLQYYDNYSQYDTVKINESDLADLNKKYEADFRGVYGENIIFNSNLGSVDNDTKSEYYKSNMSGFIEFSNETILAGVAPVDYDEIAITDYTFDVFKHFKFKNSDNTTVTINNYSDIINKTISVKLNSSDNNSYNYYVIDGTKEFAEDASYKICAVVDTNFDFARYDMFLKNDFDANTASTQEQLLYYYLFSEYTNELNYGLSNLAYVKTGFIFDFNSKALKYAQLGYKEGLSLNVSGISNDYYGITIYSGKNLSVFGSDYYVKDSVTSVADGEIIIPRSILFTMIDSLKNTEKWNDYLASLTTQGKDTFFSLLGQAENYDILSLDTLLKDYGLLELLNNHKVTITDGGTSYVMDIIGVIYNDYFEFNFIASETMFNHFYDNADSGVYTAAVTATPSKSVLKKMVSDNFSEDADIRYEIKSSVIYLLSTINEVIKTLAKVFLYVGIFFAIFASLMLSNFIATSVSYKKQEIGILRAIGSRSNDVFKIFFSESFIIAMINYVITCILTVTFTLVINHALTARGINITVLIFGFRQLGLLLLICLFVAFIASFLPVKKIAAKRPIDAIRNR